MNDLLLVSEVHATIRDMDAQRVREKLLLCTLELSGQDDNCTMLMFRAMDVALKDGDVHDFLGRKIKKLVDSI